MLLKGGHLVKDTLSSLHRDHTVCTVHTGKTGSVHLFTLSPGQSTARALDLLYPNSVTPHPHQYPSMSWGPVVEYLLQLHSALSAVTPLPLLVLPQNTACDSREPAKAEEWPGPSKIPRDAVSVARPRRRGGGYLPHVHMCCSIFKIPSWKAAGFGTCAASKL